MKDARELFDKLSTQSYFIRVDERHPLNLYVGIDNDGRKALRFCGDFSPVRLPDTKAVKVTHLQFKNGGKGLQFSLVDPLCADLFYAFCNDMIQSSFDGANQLGGYHFLTSRYERWRHMFVVKKQILPESEIMGLIGELLFLKEYLIPKYGASKGVSSWSASDPTLKDFSADDTWFEVKTTGPKSKTVKIQSVEQLSFSKPGYLVVIRLEKMSKEFDGLTLNNLVKDIIASIPMDVAWEFETKLNLRGYTYDDKYGDFVFQAVEKLAYLVNNAFPCLKRDSVNEAISDAQYDLVIDKISPFLTDLKEER